MNILVTGGAGYIGSHCVKALLDQGDRVIVIDNLSTGYKKALDKRAQFYQVDIRDKEHVVNILLKEKIDSVIHFAAFSLVGESMVNPLKYYENNVHGTQKLLEAMIEAHVQYIVFSSTAAVYGEQSKMPITEEADEQPTNTYGQTKLAMEKMLKWADKAHHIKSIALRYFNVSGAHHTGLIGEAHNPETHLIPLVLQVPNHQRESISIYGSDYDTKDGTCIRDYIHVEDLIQAHILALNHLRKTNVSDYFNLGSGTGYSVIEIIEAARKVTNHPIPAKEDQKRPGDPAILIASSEKAQDILKWRRQYEDIHDIIASAWKFHQGHKGGYHD
jgi:UDP-glucose 4-epimerase